MNILNISQTVTSSSRRQRGEQRKEPKIEHRSSERRNCADRRKEQRFGDMADRRQQTDRRSV